MIQSRSRFKLVLLVGFTLCAAAIYGAEEPSTPSEKMKEAVNKLNKAPASIGQSLQGLRDAAAAKLKETLGGGGTKPVANSEPADLSVPKKTSETPVPMRAIKEGDRDPFRSPLIPKKLNTRVRENLSPLERLDLGQLKIVGIVWNIKEPRAIIEDTAGLGYIVTVGTPIGNNEGTVKAIQRDQVIVEENSADAYGVRKKREVSMKLSTE